MNYNTSKMQKEEPELEYWYKCIKLDPKIKSSRVGEWFTTTRNDLNLEYYKLLGTYRKAFIGDMQEKLNTAYQTNLMKEFAEQGHQNIPVYYTSYKEVYIRETISENIKRRFPKKIKNIKASIKNRSFKKAKKNDLYLEKKLFGTDFKDISVTQKIKEFFKYKENV